MSSAATSPTAWIASAPSRWTVAPLGTCFFERSETVSDADFAPLSVTKAGVVPQLDHVAKTDNNANRKLVREGDFVINSRSDRKGSAGLSKLDGSVSVVYTVLTPRPSLDGRFTHHLLRSTAFQEEFYRWGSGIVADLWSTRYSAMKNIPLAIPPLEEQRAIADYLDQELAQIDALVAKQEEFIGLLKERRVAVRSALATQSQGTNSVLVPTDLEWAPAVPAEWRVVPLTSIAKLESGHTPSRTHPEWWDDVYIPWISLNDVSALSEEEYISETVNLISDLGMANSSARLLPAGTVVLSRDATIGRSAIMKVPMATSQHFADWVCGPDLSPRYLWLLFTSAMQQYFNSLTDGTTIKTIGMGDLRSFKIPLPSLDEQERIVSRAHNVTTRIDALIAKAAEHIALAKERRSALISAAVTGQFDVRTATKGARV